MLVLVQTLFIIFLREVENSYTFLLVPIVLYPSSLELRVKFQTITNCREKMNHTILLRIEFSDERYFPFFLIQLRDVGKDTKWMETAYKKEKKYTSFIPRACLFPWNRSKLENRWWEKSRSLQFYPISSYFPPLQVVVCVFF